MIEMMTKDLSSALLACINFEDDGLRSRTRLLIKDGQLHISTIGVDRSISCNVELTQTKFDLPGSNFDVVISANMLMPTLRKSVTNETRVRLDIDGSYMLFKCGDITLYVLAVPYSKPVYGQIVEVPAAGMYTGFNISVDNLRHALGCAAQPVLWDGRDLFRNILISSSSDSVSITAFNGHFMSRSVIDTPDVHSYDIMACISSGVCSIICNVLDGVDPECDIHVDIYRQFITLTLDGIGMNFRYSNPDEIVNMSEMADMTGTEYITVRRKDIKTVIETVQCIERERGEVCNPDSCISLGIKDKKLSVVYANDLPEVSFLIPCSSNSNNEEEIQLTVKVSILERCFDMIQGEDILIYYKCPTGHIMIESWFGDVSVRYVVCVEHLDTSDQEGAGPSSTVEIAHSGSA